MPTLLEEMGPLASVLQAVQEFEATGAGDRPTLRVSVLRNYTIEGIEPLFKYLAINSGMAPQLTIGDYDNARQEVLDPGSHVYTSSPDIVLLSLLLEHLDANSVRAGWDASAAREALLGTLAELVARTRALIMVSTLLPAIHAESALLSPSTAAHRVSQVNALNAELRAFAAQHPHQVFVIDFERIQRLLGEERSIDYRFWYMARAPFKKDFLAQCAWEIVRAGRALKGKTKKCLVLDCDGTLWGGVVGEDGVGGIRLDPFEYPGRCFHDFQKSIRNLIDHGTIVALCSKNNEPDVLEVLDTHPHQLLQRAQLAAWRVNWSDKASNIRELARELNIGLDSMVFVDDSSVECDLVRTELPEVTVIQVPKNAYELPALLYRHGLFDGLTISSEDANRTASYVAERSRTEARAGLASTEDYLASLELKARIHCATEDELSRVAQLLGKTNQFNLTTQRHPESVVRELAGSAQAAVYTLSASDKFGDLGLVGVLIALRQGDTASVDTLLMSCRALGRKLEYAFVEHCLSALEQRWQVSSWRAAYLPTRKNGQVAGFWDSLGFVRVGEADGGVQYEQSARTRRRDTYPFISIAGEER